MAKKKTRSKVHRKVVRKSKVHRKAARKARVQQPAVEQPPLFSVGEELDVKIETLLANGDGVAWTRKGFLFVPGTHEGDHYRVRVLKAYKKTGVAEVVARIAAPAHTEMHNESPRPMMIAGPISLAPKQQIMPAPAVPNIPPTPLPPKQP